MSQPQAQPLHEATVETPVLSGLVSVIVPAYNEDATIAEVVERLRQVRGIEMEIVVVDDLSTDQTWDIVSNIEGIVALRHESNQGKSASIASALPHTHGKAIIIQDADLEYDPNEIPSLVGPILKGEAKAVYGSRFLCRRVPDGMKLPHWLANRLLAWTATLLYGQRISDACTCYKAFDGDMLRGTKLTCRRFEFCMETTAKFRKKGVRILEVPIHYHARTATQGKKIRWWDTLLMLWSLLKFRVRR